MSENKRPRSRKSLEDRQKDELVSMLLKVYREHPERMYSYFPELGAKLAEFVAPPNPRSRTEGLRSSYLTERERQFRLDSLKSIIEKFQNVGSIPQEDAVRVLEDTAALAEYAQPFKQTILDIIQGSLNISLTPEKETSISFTKGKPVHHTFTLIRGLTLSLTWDGKLIKVDVNPKELEFRQKALSFVGTGADSKSDVARNHDAYLSEIFDER